MWYGTCYRYGSCGSSSISWQMLDPPEQIKKDTDTQTMKSERIIKKTGPPQLQHVREPKTPTNAGGPVSTTKPNATQTEKGHKPILVVYRSSYNSVVSGKCDSSCGVIIAWQDLSPVTIRWKMSKYPGKRDDAWAEGRCGGLLNNTSSKASLTIVEKRMFSDLIPLIWSIK